MPPTEAQAVAERLAGWRSANWVEGARVEPIGFQCNFGLPWCRQLAVIYRFNGPMGPIDTRCELHRDEIA